MTTNPPVSDEVTITDLEEPVSGEESPKDEAPPAYRPLTPITVDPQQYNERFGANCPLPEYSEIDRPRRVSHNTRQLYIINTEGRLVPVGNLSSQTEQLPVISRHSTLTRSRRPAQLNKRVPFILSCLLLLLCLVQGNLPAVVCSCFALVAAKKAQNSRLSIHETQKYHRYFLHCTVLTLCEYILFITAVAFTILSLLNQFG